MNIPKTMNAMVLMRHGGPEALEYKTDYPVPKPDDREVLIKVSACSMNNTDINTRAGWYSKSVDVATTSDGHAHLDTEDPTWCGTPLSFPRIQGADVVGTIVAVGMNADRNLVGKRVMTDGWLRTLDNPATPDISNYFGSETDGGYAQYCTIDERNVAVVNSALSDAELATFVCAGTTAEGMLNRTNVSKSDRVLITGASGGVGTLLIQLAKRRGAYVVAMAGSHKQEKVMEVGADAFVPRGICADSKALGEQLEAATGFDSVNVVLDIAGGKDFGMLIQCMARFGRYATSGAIAGPIVEFDLRTLYLKDLTLHGSSVIAPHVFTDLVSYIEKGEIKPVLAATYPLSELREAQQAFIEKNYVGKIVITP
jgi:NADPH:quinone reductase-like Zn-dependent oxidoreductase